MLADLLVHKSDKRLIGFPAKQRCIRFTDSLVNQGAAVADAELRHGGQEPKGMLNMIIEIEGWTPRAEAGGGVSGWSRSREHGGVMEKRLRGGKIQSHKHGPNGAVRTRQARLRR